MKRAGLAASITLILASSASLAGAATTGPATSFAARADRACSAAGAKVVALPVQAETTVVPDLKSTRTIITKLVGQLKAIKAPAAKAKAYAVFIATTKEEATIIGETLTAFNAEQSSKLTKLSDEENAIGTRGDRQAKALGLPACAKDYAPSAMPSTGTPTTPATTTPSTATSKDTDPPAGAAVPAPSPAAAPVPAAAGTSGSGATSTNPSGGSSQSGTQTFNGSSSSGQTVNTSGGGVFTTG
jgi:hypothetical protein